MISSQSTELRGNNFIESVVRHSGFSKTNIDNFNYNEIWNNHYKIKGFQMGKWIFDSLEIAIIDGNIWTTFISSDLVFINDLFYILGVGTTIEKDPYLRNGEKIKEFRTKIGKINIWGKAARVSYLESDLYGVAVKINFINNGN